jgi:hypothetical protein
LMARQGIGGRRCGSQHSMPDLARSARTSLGCPLGHFQETCQCKKCPILLVQTSKFERDPI